jgi:hypothetical protein
VVRHPLIASLQAPCLLSPARTSRLQRGAEGNAFCPLPHCWGTEQGVALLVGLHGAGYGEPIVVAVDLHWPQDPGFSAGRISAAPASSSQTQGSRWSRLPAPGAVVSVRCPIASIGGLSCLANRTAFSRVFTLLRHLQDAAQQPHQAQKHNPTQPILPLPRIPGCQQLPDRPVHRPAEVKILLDPDGWANLVAAGFQAPVKCRAWRPESAA